MTVDATQEELQAGRGYEALFVPALFAPWTGHVLRAASVKEGSNVLDIACGTGVLARAALEHTGKSGRVVGLDPAAGMIAAASEVEPGIEWILGSAEHLPFDDGSFDCVVSQFGMMFFQDRLKAACDMHRVTKPGGRFAIAAWHSIDRNPAYRDVAALLDSHVSAEAANAVQVPFCLGQPDEVAELLTGAGFENISVATKREQARFPSTRTMIEVELRGWLPLFGIHLSEDEIEDVLAKSDLPLSKYTAPSGEAVFPTSAYIVTGRKPG